MRSEHRSAFKIVILLSCIMVFTPMGILHSMERISEPNILPREETRKAAEILCRSVYGAKQLYDTVTYFDVDGERSCDVYIFAKNNRWLSQKGALLDSIYDHRRILFAYVDSIRNIDEYIGDKSKRQDELRHYRQMTDYHLKMSTRPHDFISIYTSASRNHKPVLEYRKGLPESYVMKYDIEQIYLERKGVVPSKLEFYYFGPIRTYVADANSDKHTLISVDNPDVELTNNDIGDFRFNYTTLDSCYLQNLDKSWSNIESMSMQEVLQKNYGSIKSPPHVISNVPYFRQFDWENIFPKLGCCVVMAVGSVLGYYDQKGYWSICPFASHTGNEPNFANYSDGGFESFSGENYFGTDCGCVVHFGPETMLYEIAQDVGYDFTSGRGPSISCTGFNQLPGLLRNYTNDRLGLDFDYDQKCYWGGASYNTIKDSIDYSSPMLLLVTNYSWTSSEGPYPDYIGPHLVALIAYDENHWVGGDAIGVYVNGATIYEIVWWDYDQIRSDNDELTVEIGPGGSCGSWIDPPAAYSPLGDVSEGIINFSWEDVDAALYRIQVSKYSDFSTYLDGLDFYSDETSVDIPMDTPGTYYWRIAPQNSSGNWCHFGATNQFTIVKSEIVNDPGNGIWLSKDYWPDHINEFENICTELQSHRIQHIYFDIGNFDNETGIFDDAEDYLHPANYDNLMRLIQIAHNYGLAMIATVGDGDESNGGLEGGLVDITNSTIRDSVRDICIDLIDSYHFDGVQLDLEPIPSINHNPSVYISFLTLLDDINQQWYHKNVLSVVTPKWGSSSLWWWDEDSYASLVMTLSDFPIAQITPMEYDYGYSGPDSFMLKVTEMTETLLDLTYGYPNIRVNIGLPCYETSLYHDDTVENLFFGLSAVWSADNLAQSNFEGESIFRYEYVHSGALSCGWDEWDELRYDDIRGGLKWLEYQQDTDGSWSDNVGTTALAALAFLNYGYREEESEPVEKAIRYILSNVQEDSSIYSAGTPTYETALAVLALFATENAQYNEIIVNARNWLVRSQWDVNCLWGSIDPDNWLYGGFGYGDPGEWADLSNTQFALMALSPKKPPDIPEVAPEVWTKARVFIGRCQNDPDYNDRPWAHDSSQSSYDDGGLVYTPGGGTSYGSMTAAGIWSYRLSGVQVTDERVRHALEWMESYEDCSFDDNPNEGSSWLYYYYMTIAKALVMCQVSQLNGHDWYSALSNRILALQLNDGHWEGSYTSETTTAFALLALETKVPPPGDLWMSIILESLVPDSERMLDPCADLHVYDPENRHLGMNYETGQMDTLIPGATLTIDQDGRQIAVFKDIEKGTYHVEVIGLDSCNYSVTFQSHRDTFTTSSETFEDNITPGETAATDAIVSSIFGSLDINVEPPRPIPGGLMALSRNESITLQWNAVDDALGYKLYYDRDESGPPYTGTGANQGPSPIDVGNVTSYELTGITNYATYYICITAYDSFGNQTSYSAEVLCIPGFTPFDVWITSEDIIISPESVYPNNWMDLAAIVHCDSASLPVDSVEVYFYDGKPDSGGIQIGDVQMVYGLTPTTPETVQIAWVFPDTTCHYLYVRIDPNNQLEEWDKENNQACLLILPTVPAIVELIPDTLGLTPGLPPVECYIELPNDYKLEGIDEVTLSGCTDEYLEPYPDPWQIGDYDGDGRPDLMVPFDQLAALRIVDPYHCGVATVRGSVSGLPPYEEFTLGFEGRDTLQAESLGGCICGVVSRVDNQEPISGVMVQILKDTLIVGDDTTTGDGYYSVTYVLPGSYEVLASKEGYDSLSALGVESIEAETTVVNFQLSGFKPGEREVRIPKIFSLSQNYPNPFNPITEVKYALPRDCWVTLEVYNILGQRVATLVEKSQRAGYKIAKWDASSFSSGIYFYRIQAGDFVQTRKMILLK